MKKEPVVVTSMIQALTKLGTTHGIEVVHFIYSEAVAELMACSARDAWRAKVSEGQREMFALLENH